MPWCFWQIYIHHLHPSMKSINYAPPPPLYREDGRRRSRERRKREEERKGRFSLLEMREAGWSLIICKEMKRSAFFLFLLLDVRMKNRGEESKAAARCGGQGLGSWIISAVAERRFSPPGCNLGPRLLRSYPSFKSREAPPNELRSSRSRGTMGASTPLSPHERQAVALCGYDH